MIQDLKKNIDAEILMVRELNKFFDSYHNCGKEEKRIYARLMNSLIKRIGLMNDTLLPILDDITLIKKINPNEKLAEMVRIPIQKEVEILVSDVGKEKFLKELNISESLIKKIKKKEKETEKKKPTAFRRPNTYGKLANKYFLSYADEFMKNGKFKSLTLDVKRSNINILSGTYISMMFFSSVIAFALGVFLFAFLIFFKIGFASPIISFYDGNHFLRLLEMIWVPFALAGLVFLSFYFYPGAEKKSLGRRIDGELPFVVIHMASISGSGIEPLEIFKIIGTSKEYKYAGQEIRKLLNQTNLQGYDLSTALRNVSLSTPSSKFSELLNGMSITINSGGDIRLFFEKRAESLLLEYRLEREKSTKSAETFMDMYISIVIATPMILVMMLVMIGVSGVQTGFSAPQMTVAIIGIVAIVNVLFLVFLHMKQPGY